MREALRRPARALAGGQLDGRLPLATSGADGSRARTRVEELAELLWSARARAAREQQARPVLLPRHASSACTFEKVHWNVAGNGLARRRAAAASCSPSRSTGSAAAPAGCRARRRSLLGFFAAFLLVYLLGFFNLETGQALAQFGEGDDEVPDPLRVPRRRRRLPRPARASASTGARSAGSAAGSSSTRVYGVLQLLAAQAGRQPRLASCSSPLTGGASQINVYGAVNGASVYRPNALTGDPNHLGIMLIVPLLVLTPLYLRLERGHRLRAAARGR